MKLCGSCRSFRKHFNIFHKDTKEGQRINRMIDRYKRAKKLVEELLFMNVRIQIYDLWGAI